MDRQSMQALLSSNLHMLTRSLPSGDPAFLWVHHRNQAVKLGAGTGRDAFRVVLQLITRGASAIAPEQKKIERAHP